MALKGMTGVLKNLNRVKRAIDKDSKQALLEAGYWVRREGQILTPVDTGHLINSWFGPRIRTIGTRGKFVAEIGLSAAYAAYVHEMVDTQFRKPGAEAKFFEKPLMKWSEIFGVISSELLRGGWYGASKARKRPKRGPKK